MGSFHSVSKEVRDEMLRALAIGILEAIERCPEVALIPSPFTSMADPEAIGLDELPTILTFSVRVDGEKGGRMLDFEEARLLNQLLNRDLSESLPHGAETEDPWLAAQIVHLGQPVKIAKTGDHWSGGLRIAIGAPMLSRIAGDYTRGRGWRDRVERELRDVEVALRKTSWIARNWKVAADWENTG
jgi:hypothetical protein